MLILKKIDKHYSDIKKLGTAEFLRKLKLLTLKLINIFLILILVLPSLIIMFLLSIFIVFRFGIIRSSRVGHFIGNTEIYLCNKKMQNKNSKIIIDLISFDDVNISNSYLSKHYQKIIKIYPNILIKPFCDFLYYFRNLSILKKFNVPNLGPHGDRDINGYLYKTQHSLNFHNIEDEKVINESLEKLGLNKNSKFICLDVRDDAYLKRTYPRGNWDYHNHRNWDIKKFTKASENLAKRGYKVLRMGKEVNEKFEISNPMVIDYANSQHRSDIMDIYLHTKSFFTATTGTGVDLASYVARVPMAWISVPVQGFYSFKNHFHTTKNHKSKKTGKKINLSEIFEYGDPTEQKFIDNVLLEELSEIDIDEFLIEVLNNLENKGKFSKEDMELNKKFWENYAILAKKYKISHLHKNYEAIFSPSFLKKNPQLLK